MFEVDWEMSMIKRKESEGEGGRVGKCLSGREVEAEYQEEC